MPWTSCTTALTSLEATVLEPTVVDQKIYAPGIGIMLERAIAGDVEVAKQVMVTG